MTKLTESEKERLKDVAWMEFKRIRDSAYAEYMDTQEPDFTEYMKIWDSAFTEYVKRIEAIDKMWYYDETHQIWEGKA